MSIADFGRRLARYCRLVKAMPGRAAQLPDLRAGLEQLRADLDERSVAARAELKELGGDLIARTAEASRRIVSEITAQIGFTSYDFNQRISELANRLEKLQAELAKQATSPQSKLITLDAQLFETKNLVTHLNTNTESRFNTLDVTTSETKNLVSHNGTSIHSRLNTLEFETINGLYDQLRELAANQFELRAKTESNRAEWAVHPAERYKQGEPDSFESYLAKAKRDFPDAYPLWRERLDTMLNAFRETKTGNAANVGDPDSRVFRRFVEIYAGGRALDIGCGVFGRPYYLMDYPASLISGLEPLPMLQAADFELVRGIGEYLPWPDDSFSTVISATSLDHCMSLEHSLHEVLRVLRPKGRFLLWIDSMPKAALYDPKKRDFPSADKFHLFHFDIAWFEPMLECSFAISDRVELRRREFSRIMYCLVKR